MIVSAEHFILIFSVALGASLFLLGILVYANDRYKFTNQLFFYITLTMLAWISTVLIAIQNKSEMISLVSERFSLGFVALLVFLVYRFIYHYPRPPKKFEEPLALLSLVTMCMFVLTSLTTFVISDVFELSDGSQKNLYNVGFYFFAIYFISYVIGGMYTLYIKRPLLSVVERVQMRLITVALAISAVLAFLTNFVLPMVIGNAYSAQFGPVSLIFFLAITAYTILRHRLFHVKVVATGFSIFSIWLFIFIRILLLDSGKEFLIDSILLFMVGFLGVFLIRGVYKEIEQLEKTERLAKKLKHANEELKTLDAMRREFISFASHQIRTPLTAMKGFANLIAIGAYGEIPDKAKNAAVKIQIATDQLNGLVNNLLDSRAIEEGKMTFNFQKTDVVDLVAGVVKGFDQRAKDKGIALEYEKPKGKLYASVDVMKFQETIKNLIDNALKYTQKGFVRISVIKEDDEVLISVRDSGIGMTEKLIKKLFQKYVRDKEVALQGILGTGLGLYITREMVEAHNGKIWAESEGSQKGSTFFIRIPLVEHK
jgi:signal transduction histidine kinase